MELPRLRLRRVFEHGPSFKVQRAGMPALTIAKKALSPNLQAKLRKYAEGGGVTSEAAPAVEEAPVVEPTAEELASEALDQYRKSSMAAEDLQKMRQTVASLPIEEEGKSKLFDLAMMARRDQDQQRQQDELISPKIARGASTTSEDAATKALNEFRSSAMGEADARKFRDTLRSLPLDEKLKDKAFALAQVARRERASSMQQGADVEAVEDLASKALNQYQASSKTAQDLAELRQSILSSGLNEDQQQRVFSLAMTARRGPQPASVAGKAMSKFPLSQAGQQAFGQFAASDMTQSDLEGFRKATSALPEQEQSRLMQMATDALQKRQAGTPESFSAADQQPAVRPAAPAAIMPAPAQEAKTMTIAGEPVMGEPVVGPAPDAEEVAGEALAKYRKSGKTAQDLTALLAAARALPESDRARLFSLAKAARQVGPPAAVEADPAAPVAAPTPAAELMPAPAGVPAAAPAMVAAAPVVPAAPATPAVPVAPAKPAAPEINIPDTITGTTFEDFKAAIKANPQADPVAVATALVTAKAPQIPTPNFAEITAAAPAVGGKTAIDKFDAAVAAKAAALTEEAKADLDTKQEVVRIAQASEARQLAAAKKDADTAAKLAQRKESIEKAIGQGFQPQSMWGRMSAPQKVGSLISLAVGGFLSGYTDTKNYVYEAFNNLLENDLDVQKGNYNSLLKQYERLLGDEAAARKLAEADLLNLTALQVKSVEARSNLRGIGPQLAAVRADLEMKAAANREEVRKKMFDADIAEANAATQEEYRKAQTKAQLAKAAPKVAGGPTRGAVSAERLDFAKAQYKEGKRFTVPDPEDPAKSIVIEALSKPAAQKSIQTITQRIEGTMRLEEFLKFLAENRGKPTTPELIRGMEIRLKGVVENYPGTFRGSQNLVTTAQAKMITPATEDLGLPILRYLDKLGMTTTAIKTLQSDAVRGVKSAIQGAADPANEGFKEFLGKWSEQGYHGRTGIPATPKPAAPVAAPAPSPEKTGEGVVYTITQTAGDKVVSKTTTDKAFADKFRNVKGFTVTP